MMARIRWSRPLRNALCAAIAFVAVFALVGFFVLPSIAKAKLESIATRELGRQATLGKVEFNPFTLRARLTDFALADREPGRTLLSFDALDLDLSMASLLHWAPIFDAVRLARPRVDLVRNSDGTYSIQDLIERALAAPTGPTPLFSVNNIEINDGALVLDDRPRHRKVAVTGLGIGIPFLSSMPYEAEIRVTPRFDGEVDGARFGLIGNSTTPFGETQAATLELNLDAFALPPHAEYLVLPPGLKLKDGALTTRLKLTFLSEKGTARTLAVSGTARVDRLALTRRDDSPLAAAKSIEAVIANLDLLQRSIALDRVIVDAPDLDLRRTADGALEIQRLLAGAPSTTPTGPDPKGKAPAPPGWTFAIADIHVANGALRLADEAVSPAFRAALAEVKLDGKKIASNVGGGGVDVSFIADTGATFGGHAEVDLSRSAARGHFSLTNFHLAKLYPYYAEALDLEVRGGTIDLAADFDVAAKDAPLQLTLAQGAATLHDIEMAVRDEAVPLWRIPRADLNDVAFDLAKHNVTIGSVDCKKAAFTLVRQVDGVVNVARLVRTTARTGTSVGAASDDAGWSFVSRKVLFENVAADFEDRVPQPPVKLKIADARIAVDKLTNARDTKGTIDAVAKIGRGGRLRVNGALGTNPLAADWRIDASGLDLVPLRPYFEARTNVIVTSGAVAAKGRVAFATDAASGLRASYAGDVAISDFGSLDRPGSQELLRWRTLTLTGVDVASEPHKFALGAVGIDDFYARVIVNPDATLNLKQLFAGESPAAPAAASPTAPPAASKVPPAAPPAKRGATPSRTATKELPPPPPEQKELPVSIGRIQLSNGEVQFSDFFVKPNYSAHLTKVAGSVSALSTTQAGQVEIAGRVEGTAPADVRGSINPFARTVTLDLTAKATDVDLPPLTPYSQKYAGYGIEKGKLSLQVHYKIDDRKLTATNRIVLDQLTFGQHVDSPTATKLPILLAVALLKDGNGVIDLDLPIQGTLDDPQFSMWGVIVQIIENLIVKVVTAPFALLGALAGGHGEELAYVEFAPGHAELSAPADAKLQSLAKALTDRPALKLDIAGRAVPDVDREGLKRATLDRAMRLQKQKALVAKGESAPSVDSLEIDAKEYPDYLTAVYNDADLKTKPRNVLGFAKTIPPAEMEALLTASYGADDDALSKLASQRALAAKEWLVEKGGVPSERVFVVASKMGSDDVKDKGAPTRADFAIR